MALADILTDVLGDDLPVAIEAYDGTRLGPPDPPATVVVRSPDALRRILQAPGELGFARAYVSGDLDVDGDVFAALALRHHLPDVRLDRRQLVALARLVGPAGLRRLPPPPEEARLRGSRHSRARDAAAIAHHYDVSNDFYRTLLGPAMTYSCAVFEAPDRTLEEAQAAKYELICRKLGLRPGMRLLDVGAGWGGMVRHAVQHHGVRAVGITVSRQQVEWAKARITDEGLADRAEVRYQDYRDVHDGPYDAISSIGMFEHVGLDRLGEYVAKLRSLLRPGGRFLNHAISRPGHHEPQRTRFARSGFIDRYVFPDGELHEVGSVVSAVQAQQLEVRHLESLREHYALTLRSWVSNLEAGWDRAVAAAGEARARIWRLYLAGSALGFEENHIQVHQVLAVATPEDGRSEVALRPTWEQAALA